MAEKKKNEMAESSEPNSAAGRVFWTLQNNAEHACTFKRVFFVCLFVSQEINRCATLLP